jgi:hypothetical protein
MAGDVYILDAVRTPIGRHGAHSPACGQTTSRRTR